MKAVDVAGVEANGMSGFGGTITVLEEVVRELQRTGHFTGTLEAEDEEIEDEAIVLEDESGELKTTDEAISVGVRHVYKELVSPCNESDPNVLTFVREDRVVLRRDVVHQVVVKDETEEAVEKGEVNLLVHAREGGLHHDVALAVGSLPDVCEVIDTLTPLQVDTISVTDHRARLLLTLYTRSGGGSVSAGLIQAGKRPRLSAS